MQTRRRVRSTCLLPCHLSHKRQERNALVSLSCHWAGPHGWLHFADMQDMSPTHWRGVGGLYMPRSTIISQSAWGKRPVLELLIWHSRRLTGNILVLGSVTPMASGCQKLNYLSPSVSFNSSTLTIATASYSHHWHLCWWRYKTRVSAPFTPQDCRVTANCSGTPLTPNFSDLRTHMNKKRKIWPRMNKFVYHGNFIMIKCICIAVSPSTSVAWEFSVYFSLMKFRNIADRPTQLSPYHY